MGFHWPELVIITVVALLVFGPKRLPEMGSSPGRALKEFKRALGELGEEAPKIETRPAGEDHPHVGGVASGVLRNGPAADAIASREWNL